MTRQVSYSAPAAACAAEVLNALRRHADPITLAQLERQLPQSKSLIFRVLRELEARDFVVRDQTGRFRLGIEAFEVATAYLSQWGLADVVRLTLEQLADATGNTVNLGVLRGSQVLYLMKFQGASAYVTVSRVGGRVPANCVAIGKALLAQLPDNEVRRRFSDPLPRMTDQSVRTVDGLLAELRDVHRQGYAIDREQAAEGRCGLAVITVAGSSDHDVAAISISTSAKEFDEHLDRMLEQLLAARDLFERDHRTRSGLGASTEGVRPDAPDFPSATS